MGAHLGAEAYERHPGVVEAWLRILSAGGQRVAFATDVSPCGRLIRSQEEAVMMQKARGRCPFGIVVVMLMMLAVGAGLSLPAAAQNATTTAEKPPSAKSQSTTFESELAASELARVGQEISRLSDELAGLKARKATFAGLTPILASLEQLHARSREICSLKPEKQGDVRDQFENISKQLRRSTFDVGGVFPWDTGPTTFQGLCLSNPETTLQSFSDAIKQPQIDSQITDIEKSIAELSTKRTELIKQMSEGVAALKVTGNIPWLMLIIFGVGAAVLGGVKLFDQSIQFELVSSGQIVQFVTILILLGVILALGLAERLQAETLGTLLGGLAGYVLSQGIGRQERQRVIDAIKAVAPIPGT
jgi:hypothetical protein